VDANALPRLAAAGELNAKLSRVKSDTRSDTFDTRSQAFLSASGAV